MSKIFLKNTPIDQSRHPTNHKLVINSNIFYGKALQLLLKSLLDIEFKDFNNTIVVRGQCDSDKEPRLVPISDICELDNNDNIILIDTKLNNFDYTGYNVLYEYHSHDLIMADWYMYVLDTSTFEKKFLKFISTARLLKNEIVISPCPHSNICAFGYNVIKNYKNNFSIPLTKEEAVSLEFNHDITKNTRSILHFGDIFYTDHREYKGAFDIYNNNHYRQKFYYPYFGINKWIFWGHHGDMTGNVNRIGNVNK